MLLQTHSCAHRRKAVPVYLSGLRQVVCREIGHDPVRSCVWLDGSLMLNSRCVVDPRHLQTHSRDKPFKCTYTGCTKSFKGKDYLGAFRLRNGYDESWMMVDSVLLLICSEFHLKIHAEGNPYACEHPTCSKTFCSPKSLKKHIRLWHNPGGKSTSMYVTGWLHAQAFLGCVA